jgi:hypothetical protein
MKYWLGLSVPYVIFICRLGIVLLAEYQQADENRSLQIPPSEPDRPMQTRVFYPSMANIVWFSFLLLSVVGMIAFSQYRNGHIFELAKWLRGAEFFLLGAGLLGYMVLGYCRGYVYVDAERIEVQGAIFKRMIDCDEIEDLVIGRNTIFLRKTGSWLPVILQDYRQKQEMFELFWRVKWRGSKLLNMTE